MTRHPYHTRYVGLLALMVGLAVIGISSAASSPVVAAPRLPMVYQLPRPSSGVAQIAQDCAVTPVQSAPFTLEQKGLEDLPWLKAVPESSGITAHLFYMGGSVDGQALHVGGKNPDSGANDKILWFIVPRSQADQLEINGKNLTTGTDVYHQEVPQAICGLTCFPSIIELPTAGCWQLDLKVGDITGMVTLLAVEPHALVPATPASPAHETETF